MEDRLVTVQWAADYCGVDPRTIRVWIKEGKLTALKSDPTKIKSAVRLRESDVKSVFRPVPAEAVGQA